MDYSTLQTTVARGQFEATADLEAIKDGILEAYRRIWFRHLNWDFRRIGPTNLTVAAGTESPTLDLDSASVVLAADVIAVYDDLGQKLRRMSPSVFDEQFRASFVQNERDRPFAYKWQNGVLTLGPRPSSSYTFTYVYERQMGFLNAGTTFKVGDMSGSTDTPAWDARHHRALVWEARSIVAEEQASPYAVTAHEQSEIALETMERALLIDSIMPAQWPAYSA